MATPATPEQLDARLEEILTFVNSLPLGTHAERLETARFLAAKHFTSDPDAAWDGTNPPDCDELLEEKKSAPDGHSDSGCDVDNAPGADDYAGVHEPEAPCACTPGGNLSLGDSVILDPVICDAQQIPQPTPEPA